MYANTVGLFNQYVVVILVLRLNGEPLPILQFKMFLTD